MENRHVISVREIGSGYVNRDLAQYIGHGRDKRLTVVTAIPSLKSTLVVFSDAKLPNEVVYSGDQIDEAVKVYNSF